MTSQLQYWNQVEVLFLCNSENHEHSRFKFYRIILFLRMQSKYVNFVVAMATEETIHPFQFGSWNSLRSFSEFRSIFQNLWTKWYFLSFEFHSCSCDVISPSFAYQDGGLYIASFLTLNANILRTTSDIKKKVNSVLSYFVRSYVWDQHVLGWTFPLRYEVQR